MAYENDIIMRQVRDMTRMLAKILFGKNTATYEYKEEDRHTATDSLYARLIALVDAGKINEAENRLYEELERDEEGTFEVAIGFYDYLNELPEEFLEEHDYSKEEVKEGAQSLADRKGLGLLGEYNIYAVFCNYKTKVETAYDITQLSFEFGKRFNI